jgi:hypothetical protein
VKAQMCGPVVHGNEALWGGIYRRLGPWRRGETTIDSPLQDNASCVNVLYI